MECRFFLSGTLFVAKRHAACDLAAVRYRLSGTPYAT